MKFAFRLPLLLTLCGSLVSLASGAETKPLKVLLLTGGCCHDYKAQTGILKKGIEARINAEVDEIHVDDESTKPALPIYGNPDYGKGYDLIIHDECAADVKDETIVRGVLKPHDEGIPALALHCAMHCYRVGEYTKPQETGTPGAMWFDLLGIQSSGHGSQQPIAISFIDKEHPITKGAADWTTVNEELYNNVKIFDTAHPLAKGKQGDQETVVVWTNLYGAKKTRVFCTTIGHNNITVGDDKYLDMIAKGVLWATDKIDENGKAKEGYGKTK
jgi:hypothetical protein